MRLIDADVFKKYIIKGFEEMKSQFKTEFYLDIATRVTESFLEDIDEQPTVEAQPTDAKQDCEHCIYTYGTLGCCDMVNNEWVYDCDFGKEQYKKEHEAHPTDAVSREAALLALTGMDLPTDRDKLIALFTNRIQQLPSVTPRTNLAETSQDCISREQAIKQCGFGMTSLLIADNLRRLPPVTPERPKGKWIHPYKSDIACECSECHIQMPITNYYHYCPNCGANMSGGGENADSD